MIVTCFINKIIYIFVKQTMSNTLDNLVRDGGAYEEMIEEKKVSRPFVTYSCKHTLSVTG